MPKDIEYDLQALKDGLLKIDKNIKIFEKAIDDEFATKRDYIRMIRVLEEKQTLEA